MPKTVLKHLSKGKIIEPCPFCNAVPEFTSCPGSEHVSLDHICRMMYYGRTLFVHEIDKVLNEWNTEIKKARTCRVTVVEQPAQPTEGQLRASFEAAVAKIPGFHENWLTKSHDGEGYIADIELAWLIWQEGHKII